MKEAFEKLKRRIEARKETVLPERNYMFGKLGVVSAEATNRTIDAVLSIVSEVEAEYGNGKTNADRIRSMSDEELAEYIEPRWFDCSDFCEDFDAGCSYTCKHNKGAEFLLNWLKSPTND